ncbi:molecular chaperone Hsp90 [Rhizobium leguminosarum]|uniref:ATP-binding protein n=1 Tax=Rhizobium leguminosarum TaxID=384 RepID=UPI001C91EBB3|nr:ATP-binding protein [Rhizobium leguminosarum]MBY2941833.1 molecular chaperone Hsp90 [Rhizobium leguminosarum]
MKSEHTTRLDRASLLAAKGAGDTEELHEIVIGRDVLELVSSAMYIDPMTVYREYIQNAADSIDDARRRGLLLPDDSGEVTIAIDPSSRSIRIRDNGTGLSNSEFARKMAALGASSKRGTSARGFRGVGRLAGLGYAQELIFRSRTTAGEAVAELTWDCRKLKSALRQGDGDIESLIRSVATLRKRPGGDFPERFFEVELRGVLRLRNDRLMSPAAVDEYLGQVAPVPFAPEFRFGEEIRSSLANVVDLGELHIRIDGNDRPVYRPHRDVFVQEDGKSIVLDTLTVSQIPGIDGDIAAIAWIIHHDYEGALPNSAGVKGLRLRCGNVQIGEHALLEELFPETRFNSWAVGEIHVVDRKIVPNGRRDHFDQNAHYHNLTNQLAPIARDIARRCRTSSVRRKWEREFDIHARSTVETLEVIAQGALDVPARQKLALTAELSLTKVSRIAEMDVLSDGAEPLREQAVLLRKRLDDLMTDDLVVASPLARLPDQERAQYETFFQLIYECSANRVVAKALVDKILARLH